MSVRKICIAIPLPAPPLSVTIPGMGELKTMRELAMEGYDACNDARAFLQMLLPALAGLSLPLCILRCVSAITKVFDTSSFPPISVGAITKMIRECSCLTGFTPFAFCGTLRGIINGILAILTCIVGLLSDIVRLEAQIAELAAGGADQAILSCMTANSAALRSTIQDAFKPVSEFFSSVQFLFSFVGVAVGEIGELTGDTTAAVLAAIIPIQQALQLAASVVNEVCPA